MEPSRFRPHRGCAKIGRRCHRRTCARSTRIEAQQIWIACETAPRAPAIERRVAAKIRPLRKICFAENDGAGRAQHDSPPRNPKERCCLRVRAILLSSAFCQQLRGCPSPGSENLFELGFQISNVRLPLDRLAGYAADEFVHRELATVLIKVRRCPVQQRIEFAASDVVRDARDILHRFVEELRREEIAKRVTREIPKSALGPVNILQHPVFIGRRHNAKELFEPRLPCGG